MVKKKMSTRFTITTWKQIFPTISKIKSQKNVRIMIRTQLPSMSHNKLVDEMEEFMWFEREDHDLRDCAYLAN